MYKLHRLYSNGAGHFNSGVFVNCNTDLYCCWPLPHTTWQIFKFHFRLNSNGLNGVGRFDPGIFVNCNTDLYCCWPPPHTTWQIVKFHFRFIFKWFKWCRMFRPGDLCQLQYRSVFQLTPTTHHHHMQPPLHSISWPQASGECVPVAGRKNTYQCKLQWEMTTNTDLYCSWQRTPGETSCTIWIQAVKFAQSYFSVLYSEAHSAQLVPTQISITTACLLHMNQHMDNALAGKLTHLETPPPPHSTSCNWITKYSTCTPWVYDVTNQFCQKLASLLLVYVLFVACLCKVYVLNTTI